MEVRDVNGRKNGWECYKEKEFASNKVKGMTQRNSKIAIDVLKDLEVGIGSSVNGKKSPATLLKIRNAFIQIHKYSNKKPFESHTRESISKMCDFVNSEQFAKNVKNVFGILFRKGVIKEKIFDHIKTSDYSKGKPPWVYLTENEAKEVINNCNANMRAIIMFCLDSGIRPSELMRMRVCFFEDNYKTLIIPEKHLGEKVSKTFERKIKLKLCSKLIGEYVKRNKLSKNDYLIQITQKGINKALRVGVEKMLNDEKIFNSPTKAGEKYSQITLTDIRHVASCYWLNRYKDYKGLMYRMGWKKQDKIFYYSEFLNLRDTIDDDDMVTDEDKSKFEKEIMDLRKELSNRITRKEMMEILKQAGDETIKDMMNETKANLKKSKTALEVLNS